MSFPIDDSVVCSIETTGDSSVIDQMEHGPHTDATDRSGGAPTVATTVAKEPIMVNSQLSKKVPIWMDCSGVGSSRGVEPSSTNESCQFDHNCQVQKVTKSQVTFMWKMPRSRSHTNFLHAACVCCQLEHSAAGSHMVEMCSTQNSVQACTSARAGCAHLCCRSVTRVTFCI